MAGSVSSHVESVLKNRDVSRSRSTQPVFFFLANSSNLPKNTILMCLAAGLFFFLAACGLGLPVVQGPSSPCSVAISKDAADRLVQRIDAATKTRGATVTITASSQELTSLLNLALDQAKRADPTASIPLENPTVCFANGKMTLYGKVNALAVNTTGLITVAANVRDGHADFRVEQVNLGPLSVPAGLGDMVSTLINTTLNQNLGQIQLTQMTIRGDQIVLAGKVR